MKNVLGLLGSGSREGSTLATATTHTGTGAVEAAASDAGNNGMASSASHFEVEAKSGDLSTGSATFPYLSKNADAGAPLVVLGTADSAGIGSMQQHPTGSSHVDKSSPKGHSSRDSIRSASGDEGRLFSTAGSEFLLVEKKNAGGRVALVLESSAGPSHTGASASLLSASSSGSASEGADAEHHDEIYGTKLGSRVCSLLYFRS